MRGGDTPAGYRFVRQDADGGRLYGASDSAELRPPAPRLKPKPRPCIDWPSRHAAARSRIIPGELDDFAEEVGLSGDAFDLLGVGVEDRAGSGWLFPERDAGGAVVGLVRRTPAGRKLALKGSRRGLTFRHPLPEADPVLVVEGPTDTAAAMQAGFTAVGRPSASGGGDLLAALLAGRDVVVLGENDRKPDGTWPGRDGANRIANRLRRPSQSVRVMFPPAGVKDVRAWLAGGAA
jgi:hypothetical protein